MTTTFLSLEQMASGYKIEQDWLFEKLLGKLNAHMHLILSADQGWDSNCQKRIRILYLFFGR
jgi:hypothetical protein